MLTDSRINKWTKNWLLFAVLLSLMLIDHIITLTHFGFIYTDIDQTVMWNGAFDYSKGIFHEPFFYGQPYNYMLESFLAVPILWLHIPVYMALPISTSIISVLPFIILAVFFKKREFHFWAYLCLAFPVFMPLQYNLLTTISRGFIQAYFFIPLLFIPLFNPHSKKNVTLLFLISGICFIANPSSLLISIPILIFVYSYHYKSLSFYLKSLLILPFLIVDYFAKYFYIIHRERVLHELAGLTPSIQTFNSSIKNFHLFENLFPFFSDLGILYPLIFILLAIIAWTKSKKKEFLFIISILILLLITFAIPKVQEVYENAGIFFTSSRLYLYLPILLIISLYLIFQKLKHNILLAYLLLLLCGIAILTKNIEIDKKVQIVISQTSFPIAKTQDLVNRANELKYLVEKHKIDLIIHTTSSGWKYVFDSYAFNPLTQKDRRTTEKTISINLDGDRRSWLYPNSMHCRQILLNGIKIDTSLLKAFDYIIINNDQIVIINNDLKVSELLKKLNLKYGNTVL